jgi:hypothetical protein
MARIRNSSLDNFYGDGKQKIFTDNDGKEYIIRNSALDNFYGDGKQQIVKEKGSSGGLEEIIPGWVVVLIWVVAIILQQTIFKA